MPPPGVAGGHSQTEPDGSQVRPSRRAGPRGTGSGVLSASRMPSRCRRLGAAVAAMPTPSEPLISPRALPKAGRDRKLRPPDPIPLGSGAPSLVGSCGRRRHQRLHVRKSARTWQPPWCLLACSPAPAAAPGHGERLRAGQSAHLRADAPLGLAPPGDSAPAFVADGCQIAGQREWLRHECRTSISATWSGADIWALVPTLLDARRWVTGASLGHK